MAAMARSHRGGPVPPAARPGGDPSRSRRCPIRDGRRVQQYDDTNKKTREQQSRREVVHARRSLCNRGAAQNREPHAGGSGRADTAAATVKFQSLYSPSSSAAAAPYAIATSSVRPHRHCQPIPLAKGGTAAVAAAASATAAAAAAAEAAAAARSARTVTDTPPSPYHSVASSTNSVGCPVFGSTDRPSDCPAGAPPARSAAMRLSCSAVQRCASAACTTRRTAARLCTWSPTPTGTGHTAQPARCKQFVRDAGKRGTRVPPTRWSAPQPAARPAARPPTGCHLPCSGGGRRAGPPPLQHDHHDGTDHVGGGVGKGPPDRRQDVVRRVAHLHQRPTAAHRASPVAATDAATNAQPRTRSSATTTRACPAASRATPPLPDPVLSTVTAGRGCPAVAAQPHLHPHPPAARRLLHTRGRWPRPRRTAARRWRRASRR